MGSAKTVVVAGDLMVDWHLSVDADRFAANRYRTDGGAWLTAALIRQYARDLANWRVSAPDTKLENVPQAHALLASAPDDVWRIERFLGVQRVNTPEPLRWAGPPDADLMVLMDFAFGFASEKRMWPRAVTGRSRRKAGRWVILKSSDPSLRTPLARHLVATDRRRIIVIVTIEDLRRMQVQVSRRLSWERSAQETLAAIRTSPLLEALRRCAYVIVSFGSAGAMMFHGGRAELFFDPTRMEGEWEKANHGMMIGYSSAIVAAVAYHIMKNPDAPALGDAIQLGVAGMRVLFNRGFVGNDADGTLKFPVENVVAEALPAGSQLSSATVDPTDGWTILQDHISSKGAPYLDEFAVGIAMRGPQEALASVPQLKIGELFTADRAEIESLRSIKFLLSEYVQRRPSKPFSIAVFGPPGAGKSFGVEQVAASIPGADIQTLTFNLTQFDRPEDLYGAFHQIRDVSLSGKLPLVFWDEFDAMQGGQRLGWPRHFLAPMQDGRFQQGPLTHPIGTSIFVFAGGKYYDWPAFRKTGARERDLKVPDFISRLKGHLNVPGPNPATNDPFYVIRRAIVLRSMLLRHCPWLFVKQGARRILQIERRVLWAFLHTPRYEHGARSLEAIITMSALSGRRTFDSSSLPPNPQLEMHVGAEFKRPQTEHYFGDDLVVIEQLARMAHDVFCETRRGYGWRYGPVRDDEQRTHNLLVDYSVLPLSAKEANRDTVRTIPEKLATIGYEVKLASGSQVPRKLTRQEIEILGELEHEIWMRRKQAEGFTFGKPTADDPRKSPYLVHWDTLTEELKDTDRNLVAAIPGMLAEAGYTYARARKRKRT